MSHFFDMFRSDISDNLYTLAKKLATKAFPLYPTLTGVIKEQAITIEEDVVIHLMRPDVRDTTRVEKLKAYLQNRYGLLATKAPESIYYDEISYNSIAINDANDIGEKIILFKKGDIVTINTLAIYHTASSGLIGRVEAPGNYQHGTYDLVFYNGSIHDIHPITAQNLTPVYGDVCAYFERSNRIFDEDLI